MNLRPEVEAAITDMRWTRDGAIALVELGVRLAQTADAAAIRFELEETHEWSGELPSVKDILQARPGAAAACSPEIVLQLIAAARERDGLRADYERLQERFADLDLTLVICKEQKARLIDRGDALCTALESQRQATEEAMRRAEEARRELTQIKEGK